MAGKAIGAATVSVKVKLQEGAGATVKSALVAESESAGVGTALSNSIAGQFKNSFRSLLSGGSGLGSIVKNSLTDGASEMAGGAETSGALVGATFGLAVVAAVAVGLFEIGKTVQAAFDTVQIATGATGDALKALDAQVLQVITDIPVSIGAAATAIAGYTQRLDEAPATITAISEETAKLAKETGTNLATNVAEIARLFTQWKIPEDLQPDKIREFFAAFESSGISPLTLENELLSLGPVLRDFGYTIDESTAMLAQWDREGINTTTVTRGMKIAFAELTQIKSGVASSDADLAAAEQGVVDAQQAVADTQARVTASTEALAKARRDLADLEDGGVELQRAVALQREAEATQSVVRAKQRQLEAEEALSKLTSGGLVAEAAQAQDNIVDAENQLADATARAYEAQKKLQELLAGPSAQDQAKLGLAVTEATNAVTKATTDRANAERELSDAQQLGDAGLIVKATQDVADAKAAQTKAQIDLADATKAQSDAQLGSATSTDAILSAQRDLNDANEAAKKAADGKKQADLDAANLAKAQAKELQDARNAVIDATNAEKSAVLNLSTTKAADRASLGADLSGAQQIADAQAQVTKAALTLNDAQIKAKDSQVKLAQTADPVKGMTAIKKILDDAGLSSADAKTQYEYLINFIGTTPDRTLAAQTALDLFGTRLGPEMLADAEIGIGAVDSMQKKIDGLKPSLDNTFGSTDKLGRAWQGLVNQLQSTFGPAGVALIDYMADHVKLLGEIVGGVVQGFKDAYDFIVKISTVLGNVVGAGHTVGVALGGKGDSGLGASAGNGGFGIPGRATGDSFWQGGLAELAENGPELVLGRGVYNVPRGSEILNANQTAQIMPALAGGGRGGGDTYNLNNYAPPSRRLDEAALAKQMDTLRRRH